MLKSEDLFDLTFTIARALFLKCKYPFEIFPMLGKFIEELGTELDCETFSNPSRGIWIAKSASVCKTAMIYPPCIIDDGAEVRHCAFIRGRAIIGKGAILGNSCEIKNAIMLDDAKAPHFNYCGDSILGHGAHMAAGTITSNVKADGGNITIYSETERIESGMKKLGALIGDNAEIGCGTVLSPGTVIGKGARIYPLSFVRGSVPDGAIYKSKSEICEILNERK